MYVFMYVCMPKTELLEGNQENTAENSLVTPRQDKRRLTIHFAMANVFCTFLSDSHHPYLETFQSKIDNQLKMCSLPDADDA